VGGDVINKASEIYSGFVVYILSFTFFTSGIGKLLNPEGSVNSLVMTFGVSYDFSKILVILLSNVEIALALLILTKRFRATAMRLVFGVLVFFLIFLVYVKSNGIILDDCGCFGGLIKRTIPEAIIDEIVLITLGSVYFIIHRKVAETQRKLIIEKI